jgi:hypothetical protein
MMRVVKKPQGHKKAGVRVNGHCRSFRNNATQSTFLPGLASNLMASLRSSSALFRGRAPALVTIKFGLPSAVTTSD